MIEGEKLELKGSCFYNLKPSLVGNEADVRGMLFQRHRKECEKDYTQISWCLNCYRVSNGASFSLVKQKNFWYCFVRPEIERILIMILEFGDGLKRDLSSIFPIGKVSLLLKSHDYSISEGILAGYLTAVNQIQFWHFDLELRLRWEENGAFLKSLDKEGSSSRS